MAFEQLGPYRIGKKIGRGGMGTVYEGTNAETGERVAVKVLAPLLANDDNFRQRFAAEIETLQRLRHPHIVRLMGFGEQSGAVYYAMELVVGSSLEEELQHGRRFTWREVTKIGVDICKALKHAHDHGVIHRDLKPANLLVDSNDQVKLSDFGIAKLFGSSGLTGDGGVLGTADYMSPEQAEGRPVNARSDLYSLGCVLYALLAGEPPFRGRSLAEVIHKLRYEKPLPVSRRGPDIPQAFDAIIGQLLEKEPERRYRSAMAVARNLQAMEHALSIAPDPRELDRGDAGDFLLGQATPGSPATRTPLLPAEGDAAPPAGDGIAKAATRIAPEPTFIPPKQASGATSMQVRPGTLPSGAATPGSASRGDSSAKPDHFTAVDPEGPRKKVFADHVEPPPPWGQIALGSIALFLVALAGWYALQPPSADRLHAQIVAAAETDDTALLASESAIEEFLVYYSDDPRAEDIRGYQQEVQLARLERKFQARARRQALDEKRTPIEQAYLEAIQLKSSQPEKAAERLAALVDLYGGEEDATVASTRDTLELARRQIAALQPAIDAARKLGQQELARHLKRADALADTDRAQAEAMWRGIITLYGDKPWAKAQVDQARERLK